MEPALSESAVEGRMGSCNDSSYECTPGWVDNYEWVGHADVDGESLKSVEADVISDILSNMSAPIWEADTVETINADYRLERNTLFRESKFQLDNSNNNTEITLFKDEHECNAGRPHFEEEKSTQGNAGRISHWGLSEFDRYYGLQNDETSFNNGYDTLRKPQRQPRLADYETDRRDFELMKREREIADFSGSIINQAKVTNNIRNELDNEQPSWSKSECNNANEPWPSIERLDESKSASWHCKKKWDSQYFSSIDAANHRAIVVQQQGVYSNAGRAPGTEIVANDTWTHVTADNEAHRVVVKNDSLCRFFLEGLCKNVDSCSFSHDPSIFFAKKNKVFFAGLPNCTSDELKVELSRRGFVIINKLRIHEKKYRYIPLVILQSDEMASKLIMMGQIEIFNKMVDVRPYKEETRMKLFDRCVFLGGLGLNTTKDMIEQALKRAGAEVVNCSKIKATYVRRVQLKTEEQAAKLVERNFICVNGKAVNVKPYTHYKGLNKMFRK